LRRLALPPGSAISALDHVDEAFARGEDDLMLGAPELALLVPLDHHRFGW
jgi:hypothetical protein